MAETEATRTTDRRSRRRQTQPQATSAVTVSVRIENVLAGTILHLGDGRRIGFGASATVPAALAAELIARGQAGSKDPAHG